MRKFSAVLLFALLIGCNPSSSPKSTSPAPVLSPAKAITPAPRENESPLAKPTPPKRTPDFSLTAEAFYDEVIDSLSAAGKKYGGKVVELTGKVQWLGRHPLDPKGAPSITLQDLALLRQGKAPPRPVLCMMNDMQPWLKCAPGQTVKVRGTVNAGLLYAAVGIHDCEFVVVSGDPATPLSVTQLLKDIAASQDAAKKKYDDKVVFLSGEFVSVKKEAGNGFDRMVKLKGEDKSLVFCKAWSSDDHLLNKLKPGEPVTFLGELKVTDKKVELAHAILTHGSVLPQ